MSSLNSSEDGGSCVAIRLQWEAGGVGVSWRWRAGVALDMEVSLITGGCSNVGITYTIVPWFSLYVKDTAVGRFPPRLHGTSGCFGQQFRPEYPQKNQFNEALRRFTCRVHRMYVCCCLNFIYLDILWKNYWTFYCSNGGTETCPLVQAYFTCLWT